jgi:hypothetical protein
LAEEPATRCYIETAEVIRLANRVGVHQAHRG